MRYLFKFDIFWGQMDLLDILCLLEACTYKLKTRIEVTQCLVKRYLVKRAKLILSLYDNSICIFQS